MMTVAQKCVAWGTATLLWIFAVTVLLSYTFFGYLDVGTLNQIIWVLLPLLVAAVSLFTVLGARPSHRVSRHRASKPLGKSRTAMAKTANFGVTQTHP